MAISQTRTIPSKKDEFENFFHAVNTFLAFAAMKIKGLLAGDTIWFNCPFCHKLTPIPVKGTWKNQFRCEKRRRSIVDLVYHYTQHTTPRGAVLYLDEVAIGPIWNIPPSLGGTL